ncbi:MAG TPA: gluconolactonase, partial [Limnochordia bacterium]|nr:gluconolactonase [Limnochordia bacterium]
RDGLHPPMGDLYTGYRSQISGYSQLVDIIGRDNDVYSVLDQRRGRVFTYDRDGNLLYVFGGTGQGEGLFVNPAALEELGSGNMVVLDASNNSITVFAPTEYAVMIHAALDHYERGRYDQAAEMWQQVIRLNANYE